MPRSHWFRPPRHLLLLFLAVTVAPAAALSWLSWRLLVQDRALESQRIQERLEHAADLVCAAFERRLSEVADQLPTFVPTTGDALAVSFGPQDIEVRPGGRLLYYPSVPAAQEPAGAVFERGEILEFQQQDYSGAIAAFRTLTYSDDPRIRAGAFIRLGRNLRKAGRSREALAVYESLAQLGTTPVGGCPAELLARQARLAVLEELRRFSEVQREAASLYSDLQQGRWRLDRISYQSHVREAERRLNARPDAEAGRREALVLASAVESLWERWQEIRRGDGNPRGRASYRAHDSSVLLIWNGSPERMVALAAGSRYIESAWRSAWQDHGVTLDLVDSGARSVFAKSIAPGQAQAVRPATDTGLPWTLRVASADPAADLAQLAARRRLLLAGLALTGVLLLLGGYFTARAITRELAVARLQSDFVSAVSHEFRTPLTSMRHLTELLDGGIVEEEGRRRQYYSALSHETMRLHRLVEGLLNFGRMEAGVLKYRFERLNAGDLVEEIVNEFREEGANNSHPIEVSAGPAVPALSADREALSRALWNLLDNAVKYSPNPTPVRIHLTREGKWIAISVRDEGLGIPVEEQKQIFKKFVRGAAAQASHVKGTGIGLTIVQQIVQAHGGKVHLKSRPGEGSTFTILLPAEDPTS
jgi:signal transduction histidine kinase